MVRIQEAVILKVIIFETSGYTDIGRWLPSSRLDPFLNSGVTLAIFHSFGKISAFIQLLKMYAKDGPTILLESFKSLQGILSNPVAFFVSSWFKSLHTVLALGGLRENTVFVGCR